MRRGAGQVFQAKQDGDRQGRVGFQHRVHGGHRDAEEGRQAEDGLELSKGMVAR